MFLLLCVLRPHRAYRLSFFSSSSLAVPVFSCSPPPPSFDHDLDLDPLSRPPKTKKNIPSASAGGPYSWLRKDPLVLAIGFLGWTVPAASPSPSFGGGSLFGSLLEEINKGLATFPTPPAIDSPFWIYLITCAFAEGGETDRERER